jgi:phosphopentomutase
LKSVQPKAQTVSIDTWAPIKRHMVSGADVNDSLPLPPPLPRGTALAAQLDRFDSIDALMEKRGVEVLGQSAPDAVFLYWHQIDEVGHNTAFDPNRAEYQQAVERVDARIGRVLKALEARPTRASEDWLILVTTDHGGRGSNHGGGQKDPERYTGLLIVSGAAVERGRAQSPTHIVDVVPTALTHLGVPLDPAWQLDGKATGLRGR